MIKRPIIGVTIAHCSEELRTFPREYYVESIRRAGGMPILLPLVSEPGEAEEVLSLLDGLVLTGGGDISPLFLGEVPRKGMGDCFPVRDQSEILLADKAMKLDLPVLGICRGIQVLAVAGGGKLYQDIALQHPRAMEHKQTAPREYPWHEVDILDSLLHEVIGEKKIKVNSIHHQAVSGVPEGFVANAFASDGIIEGIEKTGARFCLGVQWHPESLSKEKHSLALFNRFLQACRN